MTILYWLMGWNRAVLFCSHRQGALFLFNSTKQIPGPISFDDQTSLSIFF